MATWEPKLPSSFHETSLWSLKSSAAAATASDRNHHLAWSNPASADTATTASMSDPLSKSLLSALHNSSSSASSRQFKSDQSADYQNEARAMAGGEEAGATYAVVNSSTAGRAIRSSSAAAAAATTTVATKSTPSVLTASGALGTGSTKVAKKRARASRKPPTTVLEADSSNFRAMVQQLTGIPSVPFLSSPLHQRNGLEFLDLGRPPTPTRSLLGFGGHHHQQALQGLPPLDPSSLLPAFGSRAHSDAAGFGTSYFKYMSASVAPSHDHCRQQQQQTPSMGDFLRTPLDELGLDQNASSPLLSSLDQQQHEQQQLNLPRKLEGSEPCLSMPLLWDGGDNASRELQLEDIKYKLATNSRPEGAAGGPDGVDDTAEQEGSSSRMVHIVDSWLTHADQTTDKH